MDKSNLEKNTDAAYSCMLCGTVDSQYCVSMDRQKNCPRNEDKTVVGDATDMQDAMQARASAVSKGPESASERRNRLLASAGGTTILQRDSAMQAAQSCINRNIVKQIRENNECSSTKRETKLHRMLRYVEVSTRIDRFTRVCDEARHADARHTKTRCGVNLLPLSFVHAAALLAGNL